jgi:uncharacterized membrane protein
MLFISFRQQSVEMKYSAENTLRKWLLLLGIKVSGRLLTMQLKSHPDYPSLLSIADTLDYLGLPNEAIRVEPGMLHEVTVPFIANDESRHGELVIIKNRDTIDKEFPCFTSQWDGVLLTASKPPAWHHPENEKLVAEEKQRSVFVTLAVITAFIFMLAAGITAPGIKAILLIITAAAGLLTACLIVLKDMGIHNQLADHVCGRDTGCDPVIHSKGAKLLFGIGWSDTGLLWFSSMITSLVLASFSGNLTDLLRLFSWLSLAVVPFVVFSIWYQARIARRWCRLCLIIASLLCTQLAILFPGAYQVSFPLPGIKTVFYFSGILVLFSSCWFPFRKMFKRQQNQESLLYDGLRFKRNEILFDAIFQKEQEVDVRPWEKDFFSGNRQAAVQIMVACNPYCVPCSAAHEILHQMLQQHRGSVGITTRFALKADDMNDKRTVAAGYMLQHIEGHTTGMTAADKALYTEKVLYKWFKWMDISQFAAAFPNHKSQVIQQELQMHERWIKRSGIQFTPTVFINGRKWPGLYRVADIPIMFNTIRDIVTKTQIENEITSMPV